MYHHIWYHKCHSHVNCHFVSCTGRCGCTENVRYLACSTIKESELSNTVMPSISKPMKFTKECRTYLIVLREVDRRLMPYLPDHGTHCSTTNCKASQISPYSHVKQPAFYMGLCSVLVTDWPGSQCTHHQYRGVCYGCNTRLRSLGWYSHDIWSASCTAHGCGILSGILDGI